ncbi:MAG: hypothetical protein HY457_01915 [Parcubacteria group bacterium]|nr:hypothetical protein [Parcubacteria group bacterium]
MRKDSGLWLKLATLSLLLPTYFAEAQTRRLENPLRSDISTLPQLVEAILEIVVLIGTPVAALFIIYSGFLFVTARGDETRLKTAKKAFYGAVIGTALLLGAWVLAQAIGATIQEIVR